MIKSSTLDYEQALKSIISLCQTDTSTKSSSSAPVKPLMGTNQSRRRRQDSSESVGCPLLANVRCQSGWLLLALW